MAFLACCQFVAGVGCGRFLIEAKVHRLLSWIDGSTAERERERAGLADVGKFQPQPLLLCGPHGQQMTSSSSSLGWGGGLGTINQIRAPLVGGQLADCRQIFWPRESDPCSNNACSFARNPNWKSPCSSSRERKEYRSACPARARPGRIDCGTQHSHPSGPWAAHAHPDIWSERPSCPPLDRRAGSDRRPDHPRRQISFPLYLQTPAAHPPKQHTDTRTPLQPAPTWRPLDARSRCRCSICPRSRGSPRRRRRSR